MFTRTRRNNVVFSHPFELKGVDRILPPGSYQIVTDEELIEGLSFPAYHRLSTMIIVPPQSGRGSSVEMILATLRPIRLGTPSVKARQVRPTQSENPEPYH
jgi:hypothetical protein